MARFSVSGGDEMDAPDDGSGPSNRRQPRKKPKLTPTTASASAPPPQPQPPPPPPPVVLPLEDFDEEVDSEDETSYDEEDESDEESAEEEESQQEAGANEEASVDELASYDSRKLTLTLTDPDVLDCPICCENLNIPVFQCENGHIACASCCLKIRNKCASCSFPTGYNRCRAIEMVLEASHVSCKNTIYGCTDTMMKYYNKHEHERRCPFKPCSCPEFNCDFVDSKWNLHLHVQAKHSVTNFRFDRPFSVSLAKHQTYFILREEALRTIYVLNQFTVHQGRAASIVQIAPKLSGTKSRYELKMKDGETSLTLQSTAECVPKLVDYRPTKHFLVVEDFVCPLDRVTLDICIHYLEDNEWYTA